jgi:heat shock protein HslJ
MRPAPVRAIIIALITGAGLASPVLCKPATAQKAFPYGAELRLDANPMRGSKRLPWLQFSENGTVDIDLWCASGRGRAVVADRTITIVPTALRDNQCSPDQLDADKTFLSKLMAVTAWRWDGVLLVLEGPEALRWRPASN